MNLTTLADELGDKPAVVMGGSGRTMSYAELEAASNRIAHVFCELGLRVGDHVAILMENQLELLRTRRRPRARPGGTHLLAHVVARTSRQFAPCFGRCAQVQVSLNE